LVDVDARQIRAQGFDQLASRRRGTGEIGQRLVDGKRRGRQGLEVLKLRHRGIPVARGDVPDAPHRQHRDQRRQQRDARQRGERRIAPNESGGSSRCRDRAGADRIVRQISLQVCQQAFDRSIAIAHVIVQRLEDDRVEIALDVLRTDGAHGDLWRHRVANSLARPAPHAQTWSDETPRAGSCDVVGIDGPGPMTGDDLVQHDTE
jgi:hypothetical protein